MAINRRDFLKLCGSAALLAASGANVLAGLLPRSVIRAIKTRKYPGKVIPLNEKEMEKPGKWIG